MYHYKTPVNSPEKQGGKLRIQVPLKKTMESVEIKSESDVHQHTDHDVWSTDVNEPESTQKERKYFDVFLLESE